MVLGYYSPHRGANGDDEEFKSRPQMAEFLGSMNHHFKLEQHDSLSLPPQVSTTNLIHKTFRNHTARDSFLVQRKANARIL